VSELKPCPMCGSTNIKLVDLAGWEIWCADCGVMAGTIDGQGDAHTRESAVAAWNRRAPTDREE
jgi:Lar family restriction alleviation protein